MRSKTSAKVRKSLSGSVCAAGVSAVGALGAALTLELSMPSNSIELNKAEAKRVFGKGMK